MSFQGYVFKISESRSVKLLYMQSQIFAHREADLFEIAVKQNQPQVYQEWLRVVIKQMPHLSKPQAVVLGMWSFAISRSEALRDRNDSSLWFINGNSFFGRDFRATRKYC